ncbi:AMP-binding protein [Gordonia pseudamarae]|jgi:fatty-acyl-CoA synthase|uniref:AMP-binding protein n=1 Tax=Gordonia pseudamarae TaxID=2831662 RepID=A0ABX6ILN6_9ACTN|nr:MULTISPECIES: class I adenylate-forming enzyme family protein [Gordonia]MBD0024568.1 acyl--CoA ligase [Gordonia sp. (in: high G+C Gram-positive bacteria)]QHN27912.1 AMP-binding protein [Gordonia pseudamarae]QHN36769.1 AMP-binding protein [Gordonia pseudamarae]
MNSSILRPLAAWASRSPDLQVVECGTDSLTWRQLASASDQVAARVAARGINPGDRIAVIGRPSIDWAVAALGIIKAGAIICPLNERSGPAEIDQALGTLEPAVVVAAEAFRALIDGVAGPAGVEVDDLATFVHDDDGPAGAPVPVCTRADDDPVAILSTSGSTGAPKGVVFTHRSLLNAFFEWSLQEPGFLRARSLNVSSMAFGAGLLNGFLGPLVLGGSLIFLPNWDAGVALRLIRDGKVTHLGATTIFYEQMAADPDFADADLSSLTVAFTGGNPVTTELIAAWSAKGIGLRQVYGLTESQSNTTVPSVEMAIEYPESVGLGGVLNTFALKNADGADCEPGEPGEIWISGPGLAAGYWQDAEQTEAAFGGGWLRTGDVAVRDDAGRLTIVGRLKDIIISGGINIYAAELERTIAELDGVLEVAVIGVADDEFGETPAALVRTSGELTAGDIIEHCLARLARYKAPRYVEFLESPLPRTVSMKIKKGDLRSTYADLPDRTSKVAVPGRTLQTS